MMKPYVFLFDPIVHTLTPKTGICYYFTRALDDEAAVADYEQYAKSKNLQLLFMAQVESVKEACVLYRQSLQPAPVEELVALSQTPEELSSGAMGTQADGLLQG